MDHEDSVGGSVAAGPAARWLERFERGCSQRLVMLVLGQMLALGFLCMSMMLYWLYVGGPDWYYTIPGDHVMLFLWSAPTLWLLLLIGLAMLLGRRADTYYARELGSSRAVFELFSEDQGGRGEESFRRSLRKTMRRLPQLLKDQGSRVLEDTTSAKLGLLAAAAVLLCWISWMQRVAGIGIEYLLLGAVLLFMLLVYYRQLGRLLRECAFARLVLGTGRPGD